MKTEPVDICCDLGIHQVYNEDIETRQVQPGYGCDNEDEINKILNLAEEIREQLGIDEDKILLGELKNGCNFKIVPLNTDSLNAIKCKGNFQLMYVHIIDKQILESIKDTPKNME